MDLSLLSLSPPVIDRLIKSPELVLDQVAVNGSAVADLVKDLAEQYCHLQKRSNARPLWEGYLALDRESQEFVGSCAFKGNPAPNGDVEIAYFTFPNYENRGYSSAMAKALLQIAFADPSVKRVLAHTVFPSAISHLARVQPDGSIWQWQRLGSWATPPNLSQFPLPLPPAHPTSHWPSHRGLDWIPAIRS